MMTTDSARTAGRQIASSIRRSIILGTVLALSACGGGSDDETSSPPVNPGQASAPQLSLSASSATVTAGSSVTLNWTSSGATNCSASGAWSGDKSVSGSESVGPLSSDSSFSLSCTGAGGSTQQTASVQVTQAPPSTSAPVVTLQASPTEVAPNGSSTLSWSATRATQCTASGGWSGTKAVSGSELVGPLAATLLFTLSCTGEGGTADAQATVSVSTGGPGQISGSIDSSLVKITGKPQVYVFLGNVTPDDRDGDAGDPVSVVDVTQDENACTYGYSFASLAPGTYTLAFTADARNDRPDADDPVAFARTATVSLGSSAVRQNFAANRVLRVGPGKPYSTIASAAAQAVSGDVIEVDAGTYPDDVIVWRENNVVVRGVGGRAHVQGTRVIGYSSGDDRQNGKGLWVTQAAGLRVENIEFSNAQVADENGAGIRNEGRDLTVCNCIFRDSENGFLGAASGTLTIEYSTFKSNGIGDGYTHNVYVDSGGSAGDKLVFRYNDSKAVSIGHTLKTRARENHILYNRLVDEVSGTSSYNIDVPNGGLTFIIGNLIQQGPTTDNATIVAYGAEGLSSGRTHTLYLVNNTLVNDRGSGTFVSTASGTGEFRSINNLFVGAGTAFQGKQPQTTNDLATTSPGFVDRAAFDYRLTNGSPAINAGASPGSVGEQDLHPRYQYQSGGRRENRPAVDALDLGAYEFAP